MKTILVLAALISAPLAFASNSGVSSEATVMAADIDRQFSRIDQDANRLIDEAELTVAMQAREDKWYTRIAKRVEEGAPHADSVLERYELSKLDMMMGTPERAAAFLIANFDTDGDWALNRDELDKAFESFKTWRESSRPSTSAS